MRICQLNNWYIVSCDGRQIFMGDIYGHSIHPNGKRVRTAYIDDMDTHGRFITTSGTHYELLTVCPKYDKQFPNAKELLTKLCIGNWIDKLTLDLRKIK